MSRRELLQATGAATLGALFASTGCEVLTGDDDTPEPLLRRLSKRFYAHGERHQTECYGTVLDPASDAAAYLRVRGARERLVYQPRWEAAEPIDEVQILRNGEVVDTVAASAREIRHRWQAERQAPGACWYGRLLFENGEIAWTSPIWLDARSEAGRSAS